MYFDYFSSIFTRAFQFLFLQVSIELQRQAMRRIIFKNKMRYEIRNVLKRGRLSLNKDSEEIS